MKNPGRTVVIGVALLLCPMDAGAENRIYSGMCEASAAAWIDKTHVAIASDDSNAIFTYERGNPSPTSRLDIIDTTDIEAAARIGQTLFWLTSHSLTSKGNDKAERKVLFATKLSENGTLSYVGAAYFQLRPDLAGALGRTESRLKPTLNIEGMTDTPEGHLLVGLRAPQTMPGDKAILLEIANPLGLVGLQSDAGGPATFERVVTLDLSDGPGKPGRGVRDIARVGDRYLILAGSEPDGGDPPPKLFWWDGKSESGVMPGPDADFSGMTPEAIVVWSDHDGEIFSDDGGTSIDGVECTDKAPPPGAFFKSVDFRF